MNYKWFLKYNKIKNFPLRMVSLKASQTTYIHKSEMQFVRKSFLATGELLPQQFVPECME